MDAQGEERFTCQLIRHINTAHHKWQCEYCYHPLANTMDKNTHYSRGDPSTDEPCPNFRKKEKLRPMTCLSLDEGVYLCNFGCDIATSDKRELASHLVEVHSESELRKWGISANQLNTLLTKF